MFKMVLLAAVVSLSVSAQAKTYNSEIESLMIDAAQEKCTLPAEAKFTLQNVNVQEIEVDQGIRDYVYTAVFAVSYLGKDEETQVNKQVRVRLKQYQVSNPEFYPYELLSVTSPNPRICD